MVNRYSDIRIATRILWEKHVGVNVEMSPEDELDYLRSIKDSLAPGEFLLLYYNTKYWKEIRLKVLVRDNGCCLNCGSKLDVHVDHIFYAPPGKEKLSHLQTLCVFCHANKSRKFNILDNYNHKKVKLTMDTTISQVMK